jgi:predicted permease
VLWERKDATNSIDNVVSVPNWETWRERTRSWTDLAALVPDSRTVRGDVAERIYGATVSANWFDVVGVKPALGRAYTEEEAKTGARVVVLSDGLWRERFGGDRSVVGEEFPATGGSFTIIGVMPPGFAPPAYGWLDAGQRYWIPFAADADNRQWGRFLLVLGRLKPGITIASARTEVEAIASASEDPKNEGWSASAVSLERQVTGDVRGALLVLFAAVGCLLAMAMVNVANLVLVRAQGRSLEFAVRSALGAGRARLSRQLLAEGIALAAVAAPAGVLLAIAFVRVMRTVFPSDLPRAGDVTIDLRVLAFAAALAVVTTLIIGLLPAFRLTRRAATLELRSGGARTTRVSRGGGLIVAEVALALLLSVGAGLAWRSFSNLRAQSLGFEPEGVVSGRVSLAGSAADTPEKRRVFFDELLTRVLALPGVQAAGLVSVRPLGGGGTATSVRLEGDAEAPDAPVADIRIASPGYFRAAGIRTVAGAVFGDDVPSEGIRPAAINRTMARLMWPGEDAVGKRFLVSMNEQWPSEVVAVVDDVMLNGPAGTMRSTVYLPYARSLGSDMDVVVRSATPDDRTIPMLRSALREMDPTLALYAVAVLSQSVSETMAQDRTNLIVLAAFSLISLLLAAAGIYGVLAVEVGHRRQEIGVRMTLGASPATVRRAVVSRALRLGAAGVAIGIGAALLLTRYMTSLLFGVSPIDPMTLGGTAAVLVGVTLVAAWIPARRATQVDPIEVIRTG